MNESRPRALLLGLPPPASLKYHYVTEPPYEAVVLGLLTPELLLRMPTDPVCTALLDGLPVFLWASQSYRSAKHGGVLRQLLGNQEALLYRLGVRPLGNVQYLTAEGLSELLRAEVDPTPYPMTPLAQEQWKEQSACCWEPSQVPSGPPKKVMPWSE